MSEQVIYRCMECGEYFRSSDNEVSLVEEYWCCQCGELRDCVEITCFADGARYGMQKECLKKCIECEEVLFVKLVVVCPKCKKRDSRIMGTISTLKK